ncbi:ThuA domain-containing protein [Paenibacillus sp. J2TS4]|uniref:ThuA domain-containing protein n=1 Tax=Paenibacillus sp. J2TS4 TaxID=2807194 RepID=UPI001B2DE8D2|nr:ThuA domain-containing protein [Paenibacillus sp. J2TS4]GIP31420.1 hypothetical protein J2TS4_06300 [Paenibacillus sp. J2TS4]
MIKLFALLEDRYHPAERSRAPLTASADSVPCDLEISTDVEQFPWDRLNSFDGIVIGRDALLVENGIRTDRLWCPEERQQQLASYVNQGGGLIAIHSGLAQYPKDGTYRKLVKGTFTHHPPGTDKLLVQMTDSENHPVTSGISDWEITDEQYFIDGDADTAILAELVAENGEKAPAVWAHPYGKGRVCVLTPGHTAETWANPNMIRLITNSIRWTTRQD